MTERLARWNLEIPDLAGELAALIGQIPYGRVTACGTILLTLLEEVRAAGKLSEVLLVDGSGILHPRGAGIAAHLGVVLNWPTLGVTKKLLCGQVDWSDLGPLESRPVVHQDRIAGVALRPTAGSRRPIFVSPGNRVDVTFAEGLTRRLLVGHRLPEPLYWAD